MSDHVLQLMCSLLEGRFYSLSLQSIQCQLCSAKPLGDNLITAHSKNKTSLPLALHGRILLYPALKVVYASMLSKKAQNICITCVQCWTNVEDVGSTLYKCYTNVCWDGIMRIFSTPYLIHIPATHTPLFFTPKFR